MKLVNTTFIIGYKEIMQDNVDGDIITAHLDGAKKVRFEVSDGYIENTCYRAAVMWHLWYPIRRLNLPITTAHNYSFLHINNNLIASIQSDIYEYILDNTNNLKVITLLDLFRQTIDNLAMFVHKHCMRFVQGLDITTLLDFQQDEQTATLLAEPFDESKSVTELEDQHKRLSKNLIKILHDRNDPNPLVVLHHAGQLKDLQFTQLLGNIGFRADIDGTIKRHMINTNLVKGYRNIKDFATETLACRQSAFFKDVGVALSEYNARKLRMVASTVRKIHSGDCGSRIGLPITITRPTAKFFLNNRIYNGPNELELTHDNIQDFVGKRVNLVSLLLCQHPQTDGFCEHCASWGRQRMTKYISPFHNIGRIAVAHLMRFISQKIISNKHFTTTSSNEYRLPFTVSKFFSKTTNTILFKTHAKALKPTLEIRVPIRMVSISDLELQIDVDPLSFSSVQHFTLQISPSEIYDCELENDGGIPYFSTEFIQYLMTNKDMWSIQDQHLVISFKKFNFNIPVFSYTPLNTDMLMFASQVIRFFDIEIQEYTSLSSVLYDLIHLLHTKVFINVVYLEIILKAFLVTEDPLNGSIPIVTDPNNVRFMKMKKLMGRRSPHTKMGFEEIMEYLRNPSTYLLHDTCKTGFESLFGVLDEK